MNPQAQNEIDVFNAALETAAKDRAAFLDTATVGNAALRNKIDTLLAAHERGTDFLDNLAVKKSPSLNDKSDPAVGFEINNYKVLKPLGEGGCGLVYEAEQEEPIRRRVALKVIKAGMDTKAVIARFEAERQALAMMDHPNIAKVFDAGSTETGRPYFVMELVNGVKITDYCRQHNLPIRDRLNLFLQVCDAVQHAHQKGIIHRDLKPSNILVGSARGGARLLPSHSDALPKVIDFGIAKATEGKLTEATIHTGLHQFLGTPAYMSPEQADLSPDIDTRTDIYSLGVLLYELLTGKPPFDNHELLTAGLDEMRRIIREVEPAPPSRLSLSTHRLSLPVDLDWIVLKCLEKDRSRRYETASALAADIQRYQNNEPVAARPASAAYRVQKFVRRNRIASIAGAAVLLVVLLGITVSTWALIRERAARARESEARSRENVALEQANKRLAAALRYVDQVVDNVAPEIRLVVGAATAQKKFLEANLSFMEALRETAGEDPAARAALVRLLLYASESQNPGEPNTTGDYELALKRAEEAIELLKTGAPQLSEEKRLWLLWGGHFSRIQALYGLARWDEGLQRSKEVEKILDELERFPQHARLARRHRMLIRYNAGWATYLAGKPREALETHILPLLGSDWALRVTDDLDKDEHDDLANDELHVIANAHDLASNAYGLLGDFKAMLPHASRALRLAELLAQRRPDAYYVNFGAQSRAWHGYALLRTGDIEPGLQELRKAREDLEAQGAKQESSESFRRNRVIIAAVQALSFAAWSQVAATPVAEQRNRLAQAEAYLAEAEEFSRSIKSTTGALPAARTEVARAREMLPSR